jgi:mRNA interferase MazF
VSLRVGDVVAALFPDHDPAGHEQDGYRPAVVLAIPTEPMRFPTLLLGPMTTDVGKPWVAANPGLYLLLGGLRQPTVLLLDQVRALDEDRIDRKLGRFSDGEMTRISKAFCDLFGELLAFS